MTGQRHALCIYLCLFCVQQASNWTGDFAVFAYGIHKKAYFHFIQIYAWTWSIKWWFEWHSKPRRSETVSLRRRRRSGRLEVPVQVPQQQLPRPGAELQPGQEVAQPRAEVLAVTEQEQVRLGRRLQTSHRRYEYDSIPVEKFSLNANTNNRE